MRVWFAGGGTGGHLFPALAIARALTTARSDIGPFFVGARRGIERDVLPDSGFPYRLLELHPLYRSAVWRNWHTISGGIGAWGELSRLAREDPPAVVVATGGYAAGMALLYAIMKRIPIVLQEQNSVPGLTTRFFSRYARQIHLGFPEAASALRPRPGALVRHSGNPIRPPQPVNEEDRARARSSLRLAQNALPVTLVFGGSQGARAMNRTVAAVVQDGLPAGLSLLWLTGRGEYDTYAALENDRVRVLPFLTDMTAAYAVADLAVARAGAMSTAEMCAWGIPAILVPLPTAAADHQTTNARALENAGAATVILQRELTPPRLRSLISDLLGDEKKLMAMSAAARARARPNAAADIASDIAALVPAR